MSIRVMTYVWANSEHQGSRLLLLLAIADFAHDDGSGAYPSVATLAGKVRMSERQVIRLIHALEASGELRVQPGASRYDTNLLTVVMRGDKMTPLRGDRKGPRGDKKADQGVTQPRHPKRPPNVIQNGSSDKSQTEEDAAAALAYWRGQKRLLKGMPT